MPKPAQGFLSGLSLIGTIMVVASSTFALELVLVDEDFETDLSAWETRTWTLSGYTEAEELATTTSVAGGDLNGPNTSYPGSQAFGYSYTTPGPGTPGRYVSLKFPGAVAPGVYRVELEGDFYLFRTDTSEPFGVGCYTLLLTDNAYDNPHYSWDSAIEGDYFLSGPMDQQEGHMLRLWPGRPVTDHTTDWSKNGVWRHIHLMNDGTLEVDGIDVTADLPVDYPCSVSGTGSPRRVCNTIVTQSGDIELRLLMWDKGGGTQAVGWDNLSITLTDLTSAVAWTFTEDFEGPDPLASGWEPALYPPFNDKPEIFVPNDPKLLGDTGGNGTKCGGYADDIPHPTQVLYAWMVRQFPLAVVPGTYTVRIEADRYVKKPTSPSDDVYRVGNRTYFLYDSLYDDDAWDPDTDTPEDGIASSLWPGRAGVQNPPHFDGIWQNLSIEEEFTTESGNLEVRLLLHNKHGGAQAVAWDNVKVSLISPCNTPRFDADGDLDVDGIDFAAVQRCLTDSGIAEGCECYNANGDDALDNADMAAFLNCAGTSGSAINADAEACEEGLAFPG